MRRQNRKVRMALGPTHEEVVTELVSRHVSSYRQMPLTLYQMQTKFRNEERPRFGVLRTSEFLMKDAYSFDVSIEALNRSYEKMYAAYCRIFDRCGLRYLAVEAESGPIGGDASHEFMVPAEKRRGRRAPLPGLRLRGQPGAGGDRQPRPGPARRAAEAAGRRAHARRQHHRAGEQVPRLPAASEMIKTLIYLADGKPIAVLLRGDHDANEGKIRRAAGAATLELADAGDHRAGDRRAGRIRRAGRA